jgi:hypothetical protein
MAFIATYAPMALTRDGPDYDRRERMNGPGHYREAERLLDEATSRGDFNPRAQWCPELAKLHTALAPRRRNRRGLAAHDACLTMVTNSWWMRWSPVSSGWKAVASAGPWRTATT